ncbi:hypothetical protein ABW21_db0201642 [Orbilia brochopaga]|nr:hypothetical protein ABW21_db0201642 [Drechslerella brochopaga]
MKHSQHFKPAAAVATIIFTLLVQGAPSPLLTTPLERSVGLLEKRVSTVTPPGFRLVFDHQPKGIDSGNTLLVKVPAGQNCPRLDDTTDTRVTSNCGAAGTDYDTVCCAHICTSFNCKTFNIFTYDGHPVCCMYQNGGSDETYATGLTATGSDSAAYEAVASPQSLGNWAIKATSSNLGVGNFQDYDYTIDLQQKIQNCYDYCVQQNDQHRHDAEQNNLPKWLGCDQFFLYDITTASPDFEPLKTRCTLWASLGDLTTTGQNYGTQSGGKAAKSTNRNGVLYTLVVLPGTATTPDGYYVNEEYV